MKYASSGSLFFFGRFNSPSGNLLFIWSGPVGAVGALVAPLPRNCRLSKIQESKSKMLPRKFHSLILATATDLYPARQCTCKRAREYERPLRRFSSTLGRFQRTWVTLRRTTMFLLDPAEKCTALRSFGAGSPRRSSIFSDATSFFGL